LYPVFKEVADEVRADMNVVREAIRICRERDAEPSESMKALMRDLREDVRGDMEVARDAIRISRERAARKAAEAQSAHSC
jgi:hypothetical protein